MEGGVIRDIPLLSLERTKGLQGKVPFKRSKVVSRLDTELRSLDS